MSDDDQESKLLSCLQLSNQQVTERLRGITNGESVRIADLSNSFHGLAAGLNTEARFEVAGSVGDFALMLNANSEWRIEGDAGVALGHSMISSSILLRGSAGSHVGAFAKGGFIAVQGSAGDAPGYGLAGGEVLVRSRSGDGAGAYMTDGILVLANGTGKAFGLGMRGGILYVRGDIDALSEDVRKVRMKDADAMRLSLLLARAEMRGDVREFKLFKAARSS